MMNTCLLCKEVQVSIIFEMKKNGLKAKKKKKVAWSIRRKILAEF